MVFGVKKVSNYEENIHIIFHFYEPLIDHPVALCIGTDSIHDDHLDWDVFNPCPIDLSFQIINRSDAFKSSELIFFENVDQSNDRRP